MITTKLKSLLCFLLLTLGLGLKAESFPPMWPGVEYSDDIPSFESVLGYKAGEKITNYVGMLEYFAALEAAAPDRIRTFEYARSWEGRKLFYVVIAKPEYLAEIESFSEKMQQLADPRVTNTEEVNDLVASLPASAWLQYGVHGNEISTTDAAMKTAYHLLAAPNDPINKQILDNTIVFIDPLQNPDGRERFTSRYYATVGLQHSADRISAEHNEPWPRGRTNHYLFDMNRDWLALTQPETQGKVDAINKFKPLVIVDIHEMSGDSSYYFAPAAQPFNPHMTKTQIANMDEIGKNHARHFDRFGFDFFTREVYDAFYPGYGDSWPVFYGASASTYEVGSARGELFLKNNGELLTFYSTVQRQFVASISTLEGAAKAKTKLLNDFHQYQIDAIAEGKKSKSRLYIMPGTKNRAGTHRLATLMAKHGVEVYQANESFKACGKSYPAGSFYIDTAQPRGKFVTTTFVDQVNMSADFIKEQERRRARNLGDQIYDVTGWSLPMMFNVETLVCNNGISVDSEQVLPDNQLAGEVSNLDASVAFVVPWGDLAASQFLSAALLEGLIVKSADEAFVLNNKTYPAGSLIIEHRRNDEQLADKVKALALQTGALVDGVDTSWVTDGPSFGSSRTITMTSPKIAMAWDAPTSELSAGNTRFVIERQLNYPVTAIRTPMLKSVNLNDYDVLILPEGSYASTLGKQGADNLREWVQNGGVLIALGRANQFLTHADFGMLDVKREHAFRQEANDKYPDSAKVAGQLFESRQDLADSIVEPTSSPDYVAGVLANIEVDQEHWLTAGVAEKLVTVAVGRDIYTPIRLNSGKNLAWFASADEVLASGYLWEENKQQLAYKPVLIHQDLGKGMVIAYTQSPTYRAYLDGLNVLLSNSIFRAAAHATK